MEGLQAAQKAAQSAGRAQIYPAELLLALVQQEGGVLGAVLTRAGVDSARLQRELAAQLERQPRQRGGVAQSPGIGPELDRDLTAAEQDAAQKQRREAGVFAERPFNAGHPYDHIAHTAGMKFIRSLPEI